MINIGDLKWLAGFLEGEGCFRLHENGSAELSANQKQRWPLEKCRALIGGWIRFIPAKITEQRRNSEIYLWKITGPKAAGVMMTLFSLLSPRRKEQIRSALNGWKDRRVAPQYRTVCPKGHALEGINQRPSDISGKRACSICRRARDRRRNQRSYTERRASGMCTACGRAPVSKEKTRCTACLNAQRARAMRRYRRMVQGHQSPSP